MEEFYVPAIAILTFTDARDEGISSEAVENHLRAKQQDLAAFLSRNGIKVVDPLKQLESKRRTWYGIRSLREIDEVIRILAGEQVDAVIVGSWTWSPPSARGNGG